MTVFDPLRTLAAQATLAAMSKLDYPGDDMPCLTVSAAFDAMRYFLEAFWERGSRSSEGVGFLLSAMDGSMTRDGGPVDQAQWSDWLEAVSKVEAEAKAKRH
jgi:hypothetical protein